MSGWPTSMLDVDDVTLSYQRTGGERPAAVLLHGLMGSGATWTPVARLLEPELDVVLPDARGHGRSSRPDDGYRYPRLADDVVGLVDRLGLDRPLLVGHSMGGLTAAVVAARTGMRLRGLVLVDPTFLDDAWQQEVYESGVAQQHRDAMAAGRAALLEEAVARGSRRSPELLALQVDARLATSPTAFDILRPPNPPFRELVGALEVPTLLVIGDRPVVSLDTATELGALNPCVQVAQITDAGHGLPFDQPRRLAERILAFDRGLRAPA